MTDDSRQDEPSLKANLDGQADAKILAETSARRKEKYLTQQTVREKRGGLLGWIIGGKEVETTRTVDGTSDESKVSRFALNVKITVTLVVLVVIGVYSFWGASKGSISLLCGAPQFGVTIIGAGVQPEGRLEGIIKIGEEASETYRSLSMSIDVFEHDRRVESFKVPPWSRGRPLEVPFSFISKALQEAEPTWAAVLTVVPELSPTLEPPASGPSDMRVYLDMIAPKSLFSSIGIQVIDEATGRVIAQQSELQHGVPMEGGSSVILLSLPASSSMVVPHRAVRIVITSTFITDSDPVRHVWSGRIRIVRQPGAHPYTEMSDVFKLDHGTGSRRAETSVTMSLP